MAALSKQSMSTLSKLTLLKTGMVLRLKMHHGHSLPLTLGLLVVHSPKTSPMV